MDISLSYAAGTLTLDVVVGTLVPAIANLWAVSGSDVVSLLSRPVPVTSPQISNSLSVPGVAPQGVLVVFGTLSTPTEGTICLDFETVDTGVAP